MPAQGSAKDVSHAFSGGSCKTHGGFCKEDLGNQVITLSFKLEFQVVILS